MSHPDLPDSHAPNRRGLSRRDALKAAVGAVFSTAALAPFTYNGLPANQHGEIPTVAGVGGPFHLPPLPYAYDALEPFLDAETMHLHHDGHHAAYVQALNAAYARLPKTAAFPAMTGDSLTDAANLVRDAFGERYSNEESTRRLQLQYSQALQAVRANGGGHYNHSLFWRMMKPGGGGRPTGVLASAIDKQIGSFERFQTAFTGFALAQFGSGWVWLTLEPGGSLQIETMTHEGNPLMLGRLPILGLDVWEHAYYLKYQNRRADYVAAWFHTIDWGFVNARYDEARKAV